MADFLRLGEILPPTPEKIMRVNIVTPYYLGPGATATLTPLSATDACFKEGWDFLAAFCPDLTDCPAVIARMCWYVTNIIAPFRPSLPNIYP
jgi:hypothetical protein